MSGKRNMPIAARLGEWTSALSLQEVPNDVQHAAKRCIVDTLGVAVAGSHAPVAVRMAAHVAEAYGRGSCTILGADRETSAVAAALANGTSAHAFDFDDTSYAGVIHGSAIVLPAVLAACEHAGRTGSQFLEAFITGSEVAYALGLTLTDSHYMSGWWATGTLGGIGAAAGAAKALGLNAGEGTAAIALAAIQASGMIAMLGTDAKPALAGQAARRGLECALLAAQGNAAPDDAFEDRRGMLTLMNDGRSDEVGLSGLGTVWRLVKPGVAVKCAPVCSAAQAAIEMTENLIAEHGIDRGRISRVRCEVPHLVKISLVHERPETPAQAQFSMPFAIGCVLAFGKLGLEHISTDVLANETLKAAMAKVEMVEADDLNGPEYQPRYPECARVTLDSGNGASHSGFLSAPTGTPETPLSDAGLSEKFRDCVSFAGWREARCEAVLGSLWDLENAACVSELIRGDAACVTP